MQIKNMLVLLLGIFLLSACTTFKVEKGAKREIASSEDSINLPDKVLIKTPTQTFNRVFYFALKDGKIWCKSNEETTGVKENWHLFGEDGLPNDKNKHDFVKPNKIIQISADADEISALSDTYRHYFLRWDKGKMPHQVWFDVYGWPTEEKLVWDNRVKDNIGWALARRHKDVLWHEDIDGNPHHFGTMGITTLYYLSSKGNEIYFTDSGLPMDFSHTLLTPRRGTFVAENISASASTIMLINNIGEIYTRLVDFDTIGSDPMLFKYSYVREFRNEDGKKWGSNFTNWSLPSEGWTIHSPISLTGKAKITNQITILQNGHGNKAREMRVVGLNENGESGYYYKQLKDEAWQFKKVDIKINEKHFLNREIYLKDKEAKFIPALDGMYFGEFENAKVRLGNFNLHESPSTLQFELSNGKIISVGFHTVEAWTYRKRFNPGFDGTAKIYFGTILLYYDGFESNDKESLDFVNKFIAPLSSKTFELIVYATSDVVHIEPQDVSQHRFFKISLARTGKSVNRVPMLKSDLLTQNGYTKIANAPYLQFPKRLSSTGKNDVSELMKKIKFNQSALNQIEFLYDKKNIEVGDLSFKAHLFSFANVILKVTGIALFPKVTTISRTGDALLHSFANGEEEIMFYSDIDFENAKKVLERRISAYEKAIKLIANGNGVVAQNKLIYFDKLADYFSFLDFGKTSAWLEDKDFCSGKGYVFASDEPIKRGQNYFTVKLVCDKTVQFSFRVTPLNLEDELFNRNGKEITSRDPLRIKARVSLEFMNNVPMAKAMFEKIFNSNGEADREEVDSEIFYTGSTFYLYDISGIDKNQLNLKWY